MRGKTLRRSRPGKPGAERSGSPHKVNLMMEEFVAHGADVNCLALGHKSGRVMVTGGDDKKVNMWAVGKPNCILSLSGHTSPVEAVRFGNAEEIVVAGSMSGALKIWDLEAAKIVRTLTGHKSSIRSLDFHPFGDFAASGSLDSNIKLWDIRRKGCIFTYKSHTNCVNCVRFSPDGRWIASAGEDGLLKLWDLTAGKLLTDLSEHTGGVTTVEFHPNEFLLASGGADRTVKFWDLESFKLVSSTDGDSVPVRCLFFHNEGVCLYAGGQDTMKVYGWEPARVYDSLAMGWGKVADISVAQNQLIGASFSQTNVSVFVVGIEKVPPLSDKGSASTVSIPLKTASSRRSFVTDRPPTQSTKQTRVADPTPSVAPSEDPSAFIDIPSKYTDVFHSKHTLAHSPPKDDDPFPNPFADVPPPTVAAFRPPPAATSRASAPAARPPPRVVSPPSYPPATPLSPPAPKSAPPATKPPTAAPRVATQQPPPPFAENSHPAAPPSRVVPANRDRPAEIDPQEFLPAPIAPPVLTAVSVVPAQTEMSEEAAMASIAKGHGSMVAVLASRVKNLQAVRALWSGGSITTAVDSAIGMNDQAIFVDILNLLLIKPNLWSLDVAAAVIPHLPELVKSKYESYMYTGCSALRLILKNFASVIKANLTSPISFGVDITREERYNKCQLCYRTLMDLRQQLDEPKLSHGGKLASRVRELNILMAQLD